LKTLFASRFGVTFTRLLVHEAQIAQYSAGKSSVKMWLGV
jgi:hypothetical protein